MALAVIGANWGDEGKGLAVDAIAATVIAGGARPVVVRSNGGGQAGHTVQDPVLGRHVFSQVGSGTLAGAASHMSRFFVLEPRGAAREIGTLTRLLGTPPNVTIDPRAQVTSPWDIMINQIAELARDGGEGRHGSCGMGFGETVGRSESGPGLTVRDILDDGLEDKVRRIRDEWAPDRVAAMGFSVPERMAGAFRSEDLVRDWVRGARGVMLSYGLRDDEDLGRSDEVIFEGAQGLALDMFSEDFPHVTRSETGIANMLRIAESAGLSQIDVTYMTRAYATRHGAGPFPKEGEQGPVDFVDETNAPNAWQGAIRIGALDTAGMAARILKDLRLANPSPVLIRPSVGVSCLDQVGAFARIGDVLAGPAVVAEEIGAGVALPVSLTSCGPSRTDVRIGTPEMEAAEPR